MSEERTYTRSVSQLKSVTRCGEAWAISRGMKSTEKWKPPKRPAPWTGLGIALHEAFQAWEESDRTDDVVELFAMNYDLWVTKAKEEQPTLDLWMLPPGTKYTNKAIENYRRRGIEKDVPLYRDRCLEAEWEIYRLPDGQKALELEYEIEFPSDNPFDPPVAVRGQIDRIQWWPRLKMAALEDTKTGSPDADDDYRQLDIYALAAREVYDIPLTHGRFWYTKLDRPGTWKRLNKSREHIGLSYHNLDAIIQGRRFLANPGKICGLCEVKPWCSEIGHLEIGEEYRDE